MAHAVVVVPCYNEARRLPVEEFERFARCHGQHLLFVNDGSRDNTRVVLDSLCSRHANFSALHLEHNAGKAEAVRQGVLRALSRGPDLVGYWDADLATPLEEIAEFCELLERRADLDAVFGARLPLLGHRIERRVVRQWLGRAFATAASACLRMPMHDTQCGAKMFRATPQVAAAFAAPFSSRWIFDVEILARLAQLAESRSSLQAGLFEYPLERWRDVPGSKLRSGDFVRAAWELGVIYWRYLRLGAPGYQPDTAPPAATPPRSAA